MAVTTATSAAWLRGQNVQDVCMESTSKYWIPVFNILKQCGLSQSCPPEIRKTGQRAQDRFPERHPHRQPVPDGSCRGIFYPPADFRDLMELCRYCLKLTYMRTSEKSRFQNLMTISRMRLDCVSSAPSVNRHSASWNTLSWQAQARTSMT